MAKDTITFEVKNTGKTSNSSNKDVTFSKSTKGTTVTNNKTGTSSTKDASGNVKFNKVNNTYGGNSPVSSPKTPSVYTPPANNYHPNAIAGGSSLENQRYFANNPEQAQLALANSSAWWNADDAYNAAMASGDYAGAYKAMLEKESAHSAQNELYRSLGLSHNSNPGLHMNLGSRQESNLKNLDDLAALYGITTDEQAILKKYQELVDKQYALKRREYAQAEDAWYTNMATVSADNVAALRKVYDNAIASGASSGLVAASILGEQLGLTQETIQTATDLANQRFNLADEEAEARAQAALNAFQDSQSIKQNIANLAATVYASDVQKDVGFWDYMATMDANEATRYNADIEGLANIFSTVYNVDKTTATQLAIAKTEDDYNRWYATNNWQHDLTLQELENKYKLEEARINASAYKGSGSGSGSGSGPGSDTEMTVTEMDNAGYEAVKSGNTITARAYAVALAEMTGITADDIMKDWEKAAKNKEIKEEKAANRESGKVRKDHQEKTNTSNPINAWGSLLDLAERTGDAYGAQNPHYYMPYYYYTLFKNIK